MNADHINAVEVQANGKIVVVGTKQENFWLARYRADGSLDTGFGENGQVITDLFGGNDYVNDLAIQSNGRIVAVGGAEGDFAVARYHYNGTLDESFSFDGKLHSDFDGGVDSAAAVVIQPDGKIVVGGWARDCGVLDCNDNEFALARYNPNGIPDTSFDGDGKRTIGFGSNLEEVRTLVLEPDGRIVALGFTCRGGDCIFAMARLLPDGPLDNTLDGDGKFSSNLLSYKNSPTVFEFKSRSEAGQPDGKIVVAGWVDMNVAEQMELIRFHFK